MHWEWNGYLFNTNRRELYCKLCRRFNMVTRPRTQVDLRHRSNWSESHGFLTQYPAWSAVTMVYNMQYRSNGIISTVCVRLFYYRCVILIWPQWIIQLFNTEIIETAMKSRVFGADKANVQNNNSCFLTKPKYMYEAFM